MPPYENPLIPNLRMRALYRALVETRLLSPHLPSNTRLPKNLEPCWTATAIDLQPGDLTFDTLAFPFTSWIRQAGQRPTAALPSKATLRTLNLKPTPSYLTPAETLICAIGAAKAFAATENDSIALAHTGPAPLSPADWKRLHRLLDESPIPLILVVAGAPTLPRLAPIPVIPVDSADSLALYRVAQESILRARTQRSAAILHCVPSKDNPVDLLARQLIAKGIATPNWIASAETGFTALLAARPTRSTLE